MDEFLEKELDKPEDWVEDTIFIKDGRGVIIEITAPDDKEA